MSSKSGGFDARSSQDRGRGGHGKAFDASHPNSTDKSAEKFAEKSPQNKEVNSVVNPKECDISFKPTSNGGCEGQKGKTERLDGKASGASYLRTKRPDSEKALDKSIRVSHSRRGLKFAGDIENSLENRENHAEYSSKEAGDSARINRKGFFSMDDQKFQANRSNLSDDAQLRENV